MGYGVKIWGWEKRKSIEKVEERYLRWVMEVDVITPGYIVKKKLKREKIRSRAGRRALRYKKRLEEEKRGQLARLCWKELKKKGRKGKIKLGWEEKRRRFFRERGVELEEVERRRSKGISLGI